MTTDNTESLRAEFEKAYANAFPVASAKWGKFERDEMGEYNDPCVFGAWWGFVAGRADAGKDAERYRWLRQQHWNESALCVVAHPKDAVKLGHSCPSHERLDDAIDNAMVRERQA